MDDHDFNAWRAEEELRRAAGADLLAHFSERAERERAQTEALLEQLIGGLPTDDHPNPDDLEEAA
jgi:hypothetical protein